VSDRLLKSLEDAFLKPGTDEAARDLAAVALANYAATDPDRLTRLLVSADRRSFPVLLAALRDHGDGAIARLTAALARETTPDWHDEPLKPDWPPPSPAIATELERGGGGLAERYAFAPALPLAKFDDLVRELSRSGYRPSRFRPYGELAAVVWVRD